MRELALAAQQYREDELSLADAAQAAQHGSDSDEADNKADRRDVLMVMRELSITDISVIAPRAPCHVRVASVQFSGAADKRDCTKRIKYRKRGLLASRFVPLSVVTYGMFGQPLKTLL